MGKRIGFDKNELKIVNSRLKRLSELPDVELPKMLKRLSSNIQKDVKAAAPVDKGNLRNSVYSKSDNKTAEVWVDTTKTETRPSSMRHNYGYTVEHGRAGRYRTTPYFYKVIGGALGKLVTMINEKIRDHKINN